MNVYPLDVIDDVDDRAELQAMALYLKTSFYPPLPSQYAGPALAALRLLNNNDGETNIILPADLNPTPRGATPWANGSHLIAPGILVDILRLWAHVSNTEAFFNEDDDEDNCDECVDYLDDLRGL